MMNISFHAILDLEEQCYSIWVELQWVNNALKSMEIKS